MKSVRSRIRLPIELMALLFVLTLAVDRAFSDIEEYGQSEFTMKRVVPRDWYELRYLGCKLRKDPQVGGHVGIFMLIWKGEKPAHLLGDVWGDKKDWHPIIEFALHHAAGWKCAGSIEGPGDERLIQPGEVMTFELAMGVIERDDPGFEVAVSGADRARFLLDTEEGQLSSDDIILPLVPSK